MQLTGRGVRSQAQYKVDLVRSHDPNGKALMMYDLKRMNWTSFYRLTSCDEMVTFFYNNILSLLNNYLPLRPSRQNLNDKPWVTEEFRRVIRRRQYAWVHRHMADYRRYRNQASRLGETLRNRFYEKKVKLLRQSNSSSINGRELQCFRFRSTILSF